MKLTRNEWFGASARMGLCLIGMGLLAGAMGWLANAQAVNTTTVQGTVYLASGQPGSGTLNVSWPAFTTAANQAVAAGRTTVAIAPDGFVSLSLAPNQGAAPAGLYYTAIYHLSDGTTSTEYWVVPASAQASLGQVRAQLMPAAQAVQAVSKSYVDQEIQELTQSLLTASGGTLSGPLFLNGDPTQALQAADKHYVDADFAQSVALVGGAMTGPLTAPVVNGVQAPVGTGKLQTAINAAGANGAVEIPPAYAGTDGFTNPNGVYVSDLRQKSSQQFERSVKEFGAVCDGSTDDTLALQSALNYAQTHGVALSIPQGTCKTQTLNWHGESIGGLGKQVSALLGFPGQDVLATAADSPNLLAYTRLHDLTIYVDQSVDISCSAARGRAAAGSCAVNRPLESNTVFSPGGNGLAGTAGTGAAWAVGNCAIAMPAATGAGGNGLRVAEIENLEIAATGADPMAQYTGARSTHTCGLYLAQWPQWSEFRNIDIRGLNTGVAIPALPGTAPAGLNADSNRWQNLTIQATHGFTAAAGSNNVLDNVVAMAANSAAAGEPPTGLVLDLGGAQQGWTVRNAVVLPAWNAVQPQLAVTASGGAVTAVTAGPEHGLGFDPYGAQVPLLFSGSCTARAAANVNSDGSIGTIALTQGGTGCSATTTASVNVAGNWDTAAPVNLIGGQNMAFFAGNLLKGNGGYTVWSAASSQSSGTQLNGGGGTLPGGGTYPALVATSALGTAYQVEQFPGADFGAKLQACLGAVSSAFGGTCDARNFTGSLAMGSNLTIATGNATVLLPCATISTARQVIVAAGTRNVSLRGCALRGGSTASGSQGGTAFLYSGAGAMVQVGDPAYAVDTQGFHMDNVVINTTASSSAAAQGLAVYRTQELDLESLYFLGNSNQTGMTLDGTGNYTGGTFFDDAFNGFQTAVNAIGHQAANAATTDWMNASAFVRLHIDCPTSAGSPIAGTYGINLQQGDGNTFTGGDVEGCSTALHLGANAQNNTIVGLRNENSNNQIVADAGSSYNNWMTGGTMFTGQLTDNGTRNSFLDTFHRSFNGLTGDWYGSQKDATVTNHYRLGIGAGNERGLLDRYQSDYGYRWTMGLSDATAGEQYYQVLDELNNVYRLSIGQYNNGQPSSNNQTVINAAGTGAVVLNGSNNAGTGGVVFGSGGASESTVATIGNTGNAQFNGTLQVGGVSTFAGSTTVKNQADAEIDQFLWAGATASQKESFIYKDWNGSSQWYLVKDASNNWALNSATGGLDSFKAYQSTNSGDTYINASNASGVVRINYESGSGTGFNIYGGASNTLYASFTGATAIKFPGLAAGSGHNCLQVDNSGYLSNTGSACGSGGGSGTISTGSVGQIAYYAGNGTTVAGTSTVQVSAGGTGASSASAGLANLGGLSLLQSAAQTMAGGLNLPAQEGTLFADQKQSPAGTGNNGIAMSIAQCASQTYVCLIQAPALYSLVEPQLWAQGLPGRYAPAGSAAGNPTSAQPAGAVLDMRYGVPQWFVNSGGVLNSAGTPNTAAPFMNPAADNRHLASPSFVMSSFYPGAGLGANFPAALMVSDTVFSGGRNTSAEKTNQAAIFGLATKYTETQADGMALYSIATGYGNGDNVGIHQNVMFAGGPSASGDEGNENMRLGDQESGQVFDASIASVTAASDGSETIATSAQVNNGTQGEGRMLIDLTRGYNGAAQNNYIASIASSGGDVVASCGGSCNWDSTFGTSTHTTLTAAIANPGSTNSFPQSNVAISVASSTGFASGSIACIYDIDYECEKITAAGSGTVTLATVRKPHPAGSYVTTGGMAGAGIEFEADEISASNLNGLAANYDSALTSTVRFVMPVMYNSPGNQLTIFPGGSTLPGQGTGVQTRAYTQMGSGGTVTLNIGNQGLGPVVASCTASGGSGYGTSGGAIQPPQVAITGTWTTAPSVAINGVSGGALASCTVTSPGSNVTSATATVVPANPYDIYPATKVYGVYNSAAGLVDGTLYTEPPSGTFSVGDSVEEPHYYWQHVRPILINAGSYIPANGGNAHSGLHLNMTGLWQGNDTPLRIANYADPTLYSGYPGATPWVLGRGQVSAMPGIKFTGPIGVGLSMQMPPLGTTVNGQGGVINVSGCGPIGCAGWTTPYPVAQVAGNGGNDALSYSPSTRAWTLTGNSFTYPSGNALTLLVAGGAGMTGNQGNGALVQHSTGATTANDCAKFDANGNVVDAGAACGAGSGSGTVASFAAPPASWPAWLVPTVTNATTAPSLGVTAATLPHALLPTLLSADIPNNAASTAGNAATATALAATPAQCAGGQFATGIAASGAANCSTPATAAAPAAFAALTVTSNAATLATGGAAFANASLALNHGAATTLNVSGLASGASFNVVLTQDSSGGNTLVLGTGCTWYAGTNAGFVATTSPALSAAANGINLLSAIYDGAKCYYNVR